MKCTKKKFDKIGAMIALSMCKSGRSGWKRMECRLYFCKQCNAWHLTSKRKK